jgi:hypothetical protein
MKISFLRGMLFSAVPFLCAVSLTATPASAQQVGGWSTGHVETIVFDGSTRAGWYSFPGQSPKLHFKGDQVRIESREHSTVLLSRDADASGTAAEVELTRAPKSTSSISGLGLVGDAGIVLWQLEPNSATVLARQPVNTSSQFEFRVSGGGAGDVRFFWRHQGDSAWHPLGNAAVSRVLTAWQEPLRFGLLLDGPQGSEVVFSNYRASLANEASASLQPLVVAGQ